MPTTVLLAVLALTAATFLWFAILILRHGARQRFVTDAPLWRILFWSLGFQLALATADWLTGDEDARPLGWRLGFGSALLIGAVAVWLTGFLFGRWRATKREGILKR